MVKIILLIAAVLMLWASNATAQGRLAVGSCVADLRNLCPDIPPGNNNLRGCMREHIRDVSSPCLLALAKFAEVRGSLKECSAHLHQQCASVERAGFGDCLRSAVASLSDPCKDALARAVRRAPAACKNRKTPMGSLGVGKKVEYPEGTPLSELGISKKQSANWQKLPAAPCTVLPIPQL